MDTKRNKSPAAQQAAGQQALRLIRELDPDVVITSDDYAAKYLISPYLAYSSTPVVFSGINWTVEEYDLLAPNVTGIVEVAPIETMLVEARDATRSREAIYIGANTLTEQKNADRIRAAARKHGIDVTSILVDSFTAWKNAFVHLQQGDGFLIIGSHSGISDWNLAAASMLALEFAEKLAVTSHDWMMPLSTVGYTKVPEEQGEWAGAATLAILDGAAPDEIPLVRNRRWEAWINHALYEQLSVSLSKTLLQKARDWR